VVPLVAIAEAPPPKPDAALSEGKGDGGTTAAESLIGEGSTAGHEYAGGARALPLTQLKVPCTMSTGIGLQGIEEEAQGGVMAPVTPARILEA
jgi:hypothetical protein